MKKLLIIIATFSLLTIVLLWLTISYIGDLRPALLPVINKTKISQIPAALGEPMDFKLNLAENFKIGVFAKDLGPVRDMVFSPKGTLIASVPSQGKIIMLADRNRDGIADGVDTIISGLQKPHGIAFYRNFLFVAEETKVSRYFWTDQKLIGGVARLEKKLFNLPQGGRHFTRSIAFNNDGKMYISLGSTCDVCIENNPFMASVIVSDWQGTAPKLFANGLRNSPFIVTNPFNQELWGTEMGRDFLGDNLPPDEINNIKENLNYGWPICFGKGIQDTKFDKNNNRENPCLQTVHPKYEIQAHSAPLGLQFINSPLFPTDWQGDLLVAYHGSWNRSSPVGYKVVRLEMENNNISKEKDFITGFLQEGNAVARPVDLEFDPAGNLYISDDKGGYIFIVTNK